MTNRASFFKRVSKFGISIVFLLLHFSQHAVAASVVPGVYQLLDHPDGQLVSSQGPYGLRLDGLIPPSGNGPTFSVETNGARVLLDWDGSGTATIVGQLWNNYENNLWSVEHILTGISLVGGSQGGFEATAGSMLLTDPDNVQYTFLSKQDDHGIAFYALGNSHRCNGHTDCGPLTADGWLEPHTNDGNFNDWLVQLNPVPVPAAVWLFLSALFVLGRVVKNN